MLETKQVKETDPDPAFMERIPTGKTLTPVCSPGDKLAWPSWKECISVLFLCDPAGSKSILTSSVGIVLPILQWLAQPLEFLRHHQLSGASDFREVKLP